MMRCGFASTISTRGSTVVRIDADSVVRRVPDSATPSSRVDGTVSSSATEGVTSVSAVATGAVFGIAPQSTPRGKRYTHSSFWWESASPLPKGRERALFHRRRHFDLAGFLGERDRLLHLTAIRATVGANRQMKAELR